MDIDTGLYISKCKSFFRFMVNQNQWTGLSFEDIERWIDNFNELDQNERYFAYRLLAHIIYFSEKDLVKALDYGLYKCLVYESMLDEQLKSKFRMSSKAIDNIYHEQKSKAVFVPLLDNNGPHESGNYISRLLVQHELIRTEQSLYLDDVLNYCNRSDVRKIIIVDDCVGSGQQLKDFCKSRFRNGNNCTELYDFCVKHNIEILYLTLFGYDKSIIELQNELKYMKIYCVRYLTERQRVFSDESYVWKDGEREKAVELFKRITRSVGIPFLGYNNLDFAFVMNNTIPDWSLPIFWKENAEWNLLIRRKNSNE